MAEWQSGKVLCASAPEFTCRGGREPSAFIEIIREDLRRARKYYVVMLRRRRECRCAEPREVWRGGGWRCTRCGLSSSLRRVMEGIRAAEAEIETYHMAHGHSASSVVPAAAGAG